MNGKQIARRAAVTAMVSQAGRMGLHGVAVAATEEGIYLEVTTRAFGEVVDSPEATKELSPTGVDYLGTALGKLAQSVHSGGDSRVAEGLPLGELPYRGCFVGVLGPDILFGLNTRFWCSFSGGNEEQDAMRIVEVAEEPGGRRCSTSSLCSTQSNRRS